jgi:large subunit ribosomal protein L15
MRLNDLSDNAGAKKNRIRIARGVGSGKGKTGGRGMKGQKSRSGVSLLGKEGGQMPLYRRLPKRGFKNNFRKRFNAVNIGRLQTAIDQGSLDAKKTVDAKALLEAGVIRRVHDGVRLLANGELKAKLTLEVAGASKAAIAAVEKAGGTVTLPSPQPDGDGKKAQRKAAAKAKPAPGAAADKPKGKGKGKGKAKAEDSGDADEGDNASDTTSE